MTLFYLIKVLYIQAFNNSRYIMKKGFTFILACSPILAFAQQINTKEVNFSEMIWTVFPFYILVIAALALFINKLMRPTAKILPLLLVSAASIVYAYFVTKGFQNIERTQLDGNAVYEALADERISEDGRKELAYKKYQQDSFWTGSFFTTSMPGFSLLILGGIVHLIQERQRKNRNTQI